MWTIGQHKTKLDDFSLRLGAGENVDQEVIFRCQRLRHSIGRELERGKISLRVVKLEVTLASSITKINLLFFGNFL